MTNTVQFNTVENFIKKLAANGEFPVDTATKLKTRGIVLRDSTDFVRAEVPATISGEKKLLTANGKKLAGIQSFVGQSLEKGHNQVISHIRLGYATDAASGKEAALKYVNDDAGVPAGLKNAQLIIKQNGKIVVDLPATDFIAPAKDGDSSFVALSGFAVIKEETPFDIVLDFPEGTNLGADKHYVEVSLKGMGTFER
ncbi:hypothetical protein [Pseudotamlana carrageenivorans]|uniref:Uncharacterized protein n=1 Tax=Pseudotamlana carrageenivorans TaxID=2069432 RepID=A0A2I7SEQ4_9FLAO|nr:hypothetical protein [Tamlana carrageenivorans]AUS04382.1 hypothetical protein C1A40_02345 [Tamlana carrageenivorans]